MDKPWKQILYRLQDKTLIHEVGIDAAKDNCSAIMHKHTERKYLVIQWVRPGNGQSKEFVLGCRCRNGEHAKICFQGPQ